MRKREIILFTDGFPYGKGEKTFIIPEIEHLSQFYNITIISTAHPNTLKNAADISPLPEGVKCIWCGKRRPFHVALGCLKMPFSKVGRKELKRILKEEGAAHLKILQALISVLYYGLSNNLLQQFKRAGVFDNTSTSLYYSFWFGRCAMALSIEKLRLPHLRFISRIHGYELYNARAPFGRQPFQWFKLKETDAIIFAAAGAQEYFEETFGTQDDTDTLFALSRIGSTVPPCTEECPSKDNISEARLIVSCSNVIPLKRVHLIAEAIAQLDRPQLKWIHFGTGPELSHVKSLAAQLRLDATFPGAVHNDEIKRFYANNHVDAFVTATSTEGGCPVSITEALSFGIPIIGTNVGGIPEQIDGNGILLDANPTSDQIAAAIQRVLEYSPEETEAARSRSLQIARERFSSKTNLEVVKNIIDLEFKALENDLLQSSFSPPHGDNKAR